MTNTSRRHDLVSISTGVDVHTAAQARVGFARAGRYDLLERKGVLRTQRGFEARQVADDP